MNGLRCSKLLVASLVLLMIGLIVAMFERPAFADPVEQRPQNTAAPLAEVVFNFVANPTPIEQLPDGVRAVAQAFASDLPGSKFQFIDDYDGSTLIIQPPDPASLAGKVNPLSDCPNNTQFQSQVHLKIDAKAPDLARRIDQMLIAWTRQRHQSKPWAAQAPVLVINRENRNHYKNIDVQLRLPPQLSRLN